MTFQFENIRVKQEYCDDDDDDDDSHYSSKTFWDYELAFSDCQEDASTQTDSFTVFKSSIPAPTREEIPDMTVPKLESHCFHSPPMRTTNHTYKNKSPNTVKVLMEKHRVNERLRHHCLNTQLYLICRIVPGFTDEGKETKVVMMQRIISYIAYLENTIHHLSKKLNIQPDSPCHLLTDSVKDMDWSNLWGRDNPSINSEDSRDSQVSTLSLPMRLKISSPVNDSTTDCASQDSLVISSSSILSCQTDCSQASDVSVKIESGGNEEDQFDFQLENPSFDHSVFQVPLSSFEENVIESEASEVEWLGSPDKIMKVEKVESFGIKLDPDLREEPTLEFSHADIVSPDQVLPQISVKRERQDSFDIPDSRDNSGDIYGRYFSPPLSSTLEATLPNEGVKMEVYDDQDDHVVPTLIDRRKQWTPRRHPFLDMVNIPFCDDDAYSIVEESTGIPMASNFMEVESSVEETVTGVEENEESLSEALDRIRSKVLDEASQFTASSKLDLRKSSWLNGFMMFSQVHRKKFIRENPGVHTAQISKMMGQAWRDMSREQQHFYREHAKLCSQELQQVLDRKLSFADRHCS